MTTLDPDNLLKPSMAAINAISERQKLVSNNIANAHTPGYTAKSVSFSDLLAGLNNPFETQLSQKMGSSPVGIETEGGAVDLQKELIDMQKNLLFYNIATRRLSSIFNNLRTGTQVGR